jgi:peptidoglycan/xylan/chitin deacetylase (PgdA/CDA1 family)
LPTWFRPPYGAVNGAVWKQVRLSHLRVALWDIDTHDWSRPGVNHIVNTVKKHARSGAIILMHDGGVNRQQTIQALPKIIRELKERGYVFVTLQELASAE